MIGRPTPGPKGDDFTPGSLLTVLPSEFDLASSRRAPASTSTGRIRFSTVSGSGLAVTMTLYRSLTWRSSCAASSAGAGAAPDGVVAPAGPAAPSQLGRASGRERVCQYV